MRTAHSSMAGKAVSIPVGHALPPEVAPLLVISRAGPEAELLVRLLDGHPAIHARDDELSADLQSKGAVWEAFSARATAAVRDASMSLRRGAATTLRFVCVRVDPATTVDVLELVEALRGCRVMCLLMDGRDVVVQDRLAALRLGHFEGYSRSATRAAKAAAAFMADERAPPAALFCAESLRVHAARWIASLRVPLRAREVLGEGARWVRYEDLLTAAIRTHAGTCHWLGVGGDAAHVHAAVESSRALLSASPRPGVWRSRMSEADKSAFKRIAGELLVELGYERDTRW